MSYDSIISEVLKDPDFQGVFLYNELPKVSKGKFIVVNLITRAELPLSGHFTVVDNRAPGRIIYFDPYGIKPHVGREVLNYKYHNHIDPYLIEDLMSASGEIMLFNTTDYQSLESCLCGFYAVAYGMNPNFKTNPIFFHRSADLDPEVDDILTLFSHHLGLVDGPSVMTPSEIDNIRVRMRALSSG